MTSEAITQVPAEAVRTMVVHVAGAGAHEGAEERADAGVEGLVPQRAEAGGAHLAGSVRIENR